MAATAEDERRARWSVAAEPAELGPARRRVGLWLDAAGVPAGVRRDALLVLSELLTNAIQASPTSGTSVRIHVSRGRSGCRITVADSGPGFIRRSVGLDDALRDGGRGLDVVRRVADEVVVRRRAGGGTVISALLSIADPEPAREGITRRGSVRSGP